MCACTSRRLRANPPCSCDVEGRGTRNEGNHVERIGKEMAIRGARIRWNDARGEPVKEIGVDGNVADYVEVDSKNHVSSVAGDEGRGDIERRSHHSH